MGMVGGGNFSFNNFGQWPVLKKGDNIIVRASIGINCIIAKNTPSFKKIGVFGLNIADPGVKFVYAHPGVFAAKLR
jgi:hypothetical protein